MDFSWSKDQLAFRDSIIKFAQDELNDDLIERDQQGTFLRDNWHKCANFGIQGLAVPSEYGGQGTDIMTAALAMEAMGYGCKDNGLTFGLNAQMWTVQLSIVGFGSDELKSKYLPLMCTGKMIAAHGITESEAGSDLYSLTTRAIKQDGGYVINGDKALITFAPACDCALVFAKTDPDAGLWSMSAFMVDLDTPGFTVGQVQQKMGLRTVPIGTLHFDNCFVPEHNRLGPEGSGVNISNNSLEWERCCILASQVGAMQRQLEAAIAYARQRRQFDQPIGKFQAVSHRIVQMKLRLETARLLLYKAAWLKHNNKPAVLESSLAKLQISECFVESSLDAIRIHGGKGYLTENQIERDLRDAIGGVIYGGTSDIQHNVVARLLGL